MNLSEMLRGRGVRLLRVPAPPCRRPLSSACRRVHERWPDLMPAPDKDRETVIREMLERIRNDRWEGATVAGVLRAARLAFDPALPRRTDLKKLRKFFCSETEESSQESFVGGMFSIYLATWRPDDNATRDLRAALKPSQSHLPEKWSALLQRLPYLLERDAARRLGARMDAVEHPWVDLVEQGIQDPHASGLLLHAHLAFVSEVKHRLHQRAEAERMLGWLLPEGRKARLEGAAEALDALLAPWKTKDPVEGLRDLLLERLVAAYGDPRVHASHHPWNGMDPDCRAVLYRWLTGANIEFFLDVVSLAEESHMWQPRREFWWGLYKEGRIAAAWVAFCPEAAALASRLLKGERGGSSTLDYGTQTAGGARRTTSLLIMRIGDSVVVEGSHSYKVQVFRKGDRGAPQLFQKGYDCERIRLEPDHDQQAHFSGWEDRVLELLHRGPRRRLRGGYGAARRWRRG